MKFKQISFYSIVNALKSLGPGSITGAADDDPSGIATFFQLGAKLGLGLLWMVLFLIPMKIAIQEICARIGLVTGKGLATVIKNRYSKIVVLPISSLLILANVINIGVDIGAMAASIHIIFPQLPSYVATIMFTILILVTEILYLM